MSLPRAPTSPPMRAVPRFSIRLVGAAMLILVGWAGSASHGRAAVPDPFSATVTVDATADSVVKARDLARLDGQRRALAEIVQHLAGGPAKLPKLNDQAITDLVTSFSVAKERMSSVRYLADYTFHFRPEAVKRLMSDAGIAMAPTPDAASGKDEAANRAPDRQGGPSSDRSATDQGGAPQLAGSAVLIPLLQSEGQARLWDEPNPWRQAWEQQSTAAGSAQIVVPLGDAGDLAAIDADKARAGDAQAIAAVERHNDAGQAIVATARFQGTTDKPSGIDISLRRYRAGNLVDSETSHMAAKPGESTSDLLRRAVAASVAELASNETWKRAPVADTDRHPEQPPGPPPPGVQSVNLPPGNLPPGNLSPGSPPPGAPPAGNTQMETLTAILPISGLDDWVDARKRIASLPAVRGISLMALSREQATIEIDYVGSIDVLKTGLAKMSLDLVHGERSWRLARSGRTGAPPSAATPAGP